MDIPARDLRNDVSAVLRRVEAGERLRVTVSGRPVAELVPLARRPQSLPWAEFEASLEGARADAGLTDPLPITRKVASAWAAFRLALRDQGRRMPLNDSWIAATAIAEGIPVVAQDADYDDVPGLAVVRV